MLIISNLNSEFLTKIKTTKVNGTKTFSDVITFLGLFTLSSSLGGMSYLKSYYSEFGISSELFLNFTYCSMIFIRDIIISKWYTIILTLLFIWIIIVLYFLVKYIWRDWLGYLVLCSIFIISIILTVGIGNTLGILSAKYDKGTNSELPIIDKNSLVEQLDDANPAGANSIIIGDQLRLVFEDQDYLYTFTPVTGKFYVYRIPKKRLNSTIKFELKDIIE
ncbi:hypothetical protein [Crocosphaera sp.]|uniref:hypothetical protein n=1 Tax=Crocosphaera sp. TaxID=2729996 RepID=UPI003F284FD6